MTMTEHQAEGEARRDTVRQLYERASAAMQEIKSHLHVDKVIPDAERIWHLLNEYTLLVSEGYELEGKPQEIVWNVRRTMFGVLQKHASTERGNMQDALSLYEACISNEEISAAIQANHQGSSAQDVLESSEPEQTLQVLFKYWKTIASQASSHRCVHDLIESWKELDAIAREFQSPSPDTRLIGNSIRRWVVRASNLGSPFESDEGQNIQSAAILHAAVLMHTKMAMKGAKQ